MAEPTASAHTCVSWLTRDMCIALLLLLLPLLLLLLLLPLLLLQLPVATMGRSRPKEIGRASCRERVSSPV